VTDRCTKAHEYVFLLTKSERYFYDAEAVSEAAVNRTGSATVQHLETKRASRMDLGKLTGNYEAG
jgi:hypothetical protein